MSKLYIDYKGLKNSFFTNINKTIYNYETVINIIDNFDIPSGFSYKSYLKSLSQDIINQKNNIKKIKNYVITSMNKYQSIIIEFNNNINKK